MILIINCLIIKVCKHLSLDTGLILFLVLPYCVTGKEIAKQTNVTVPGDPWAVAPAPFVQKKIGKEERNLIGKSRRKTS